MTLGGGPSDASEHLTSTAIIFAIAVAAIAFILFIGTIYFCTRGWVPRISAPAPPAPTPRLLPLEVIEAAFPSRPFHREAFMYAPNDCPVCLEEFTEGVPVRVLSTCGHAFHSDCVLRWFARSRECPVCRFDYISLLSDTDTETETV